MFPAVSVADAYVSDTAGPVLEDLTAALVRLQPDRPSAFVKAYVTGQTYDGTIRGEEHFNLTSAEGYLKVLAGPIVAELLERVLQLDPDQRPRGRAALNAWIAANIDAIGAKVDAAAVKISTSLRGMAARKRVSKMKADPEVRARHVNNSTSAAYTAGGVTGKQAKRRGGAVADPNQSSIGRGVEQQVTVDKEAFEEYVRRQAAEQAAAAAAAAAEAAQRVDDQPASSEAADAPEPASSASPVDPVPEPTPAAAVASPVESDAPAAAAEVIAEPHPSENAA